MRKMINNKYFTYVLFGLFAFLAFSPNVFAAAEGCPLGENVVKDINGALKIMTYVAPAIVIVFTVYETVMALTKGNLVDDSKRLAKRLLKRLVYALLFFFIPVLVGFFGKLFGVLDEDQCINQIRTPKTAIQYVIPNND